MMRKPVPLLLGFCLLLAGAARAEQVYILHDADVPQAAYAARKLGEALTAHGDTVMAERAGYDRLISLAVNAHRFGPEAFAIVPQDKVITVYGGDLRGMIYGALALAESLRNGTALADIAAVEERPHLEFRGIKFNLPWETYRPSSALDQHVPTACSTSAAR